MGAFQLFRHIRMEVVVLVVALPGDVLVIERAQVARQQWRLKLIVPNLRYVGLDLVYRCVLVFKGVPGAVVNPLGHPWHGREIQHGVTSRMGRIERVEEIVALTQKQDLTL